MTGAPTFFLLNTLSYLVASTNILQRGMGRSEPTFVVPECAAHMHPDAKKLNVNFGNVESVRDAAQVYKETHLACWNQPHFRSSVVQADGTNRTFHFLEYSGTRQLAEDIERVRILFGDQKISVYGISYGTVVMGTYATVFSDKVNLMILDGSVDPNSDIVSRELDDARSKQQRLDYFIASCEFGNGQCGDTDVRTCLNDVSRMVDWLGDEVGDWLAPVRALLEFLGLQSGKNFAMTMLISILWSDFSQFSRVCKYAAKDDYGDFVDWLMAMLLGGTEYEHDLSLPILNITMDGTDYSFEYNTPSKPTSSEHPDSDWPFKGYGKLAAWTSVTQDMITAQDMAFGAYDEDRYVKFMMQDIHEKYPGLGTGLPARWVQQWYSACYYVSLSSIAAFATSPYADLILSLYLSGRM
jgi:pimeloyl-ACP methyl ester carboxylesterase